MTRSSSVSRLLRAVVLVLSLATPVAAAPEGQLTYAVHISLVPRWLDPGDLEGLITVADARFGAIASFPYTAPYEEIQLRRTP